MDEEVGWAHAKMPTVRPVSAAARLPSRACEGTGAAALGPPVRSRATRYQAPQGAPRWPGG